MKISAYHKSKGDTIDFFEPLQKYDVVYASKVFNNTPDIEDLSIVQTEQLIKGGTGYSIYIEGNKEKFNTNLHKNLPDEIEHIYPDYSLYPKYKEAYGFLTRGCPRNCGFCIVGKKEGLCSYQVAELSEFWREQRQIKLLDPNILACKEHEKLLIQLSESKASVDFTQGIDIRFVNKDNIQLLNKVKTKMLHFAWDNPKQDLTKHFKRFSEHTVVKSERNKTVYVLTNFNSTFDEDLYRIYTLRDLGHSPYVMIYQKETAPQNIRYLQRWCNNRFIFWSTKTFEEFNPKRG